ncbi:MAG TPA: TonB-dependent receptor [Polyangia bacterium]|nr:TonB-dependent receptor [Polyangia bacterium]
MQVSRSLSCILLVSLCTARSARALDQAPAPPANPAPPPASAPAASGPAAPEPVYESVVTATTPLHGSGLNKEQVPANVQVIRAGDVAELRSVDLSSYLGEAGLSVHINDVQNNPLQPDLQYRGFLASPLLGASQGLSMYFDGVRLNEPFGDTINWDLLPINAIRSVDVIPGSNPAFGLNTLGGALSMETKTGFSDPGADATLLYGSWQRQLARASGGAHGDHFAVFAAAQMFNEDGWRAQSPSRADQLFLSGAYRNRTTNAELILVGASSKLIGNGPAPVQLVSADRSALFTTPDITENQLFMALLRADRSLAKHVFLSGHAYVRTNRTKSLNGDQRDWAECTAMPGVLCAADQASGKQTPIVDGDGNPVPFNDSYNAAANRTDTRQTSYGIAAQLAVDAPIAWLENHLFLGFDGGQSRVRFRSRTTVGTFNADRSTQDNGFLDPTSPIAVNTVTNDLGVYASDNFNLFAPHLFLSASVRLNLTSLSLADQLGDELTGDHSFHHINPAAGLSYQPLPWLGAYFGFSESNRAPTAIELTCASPDDPCRLPNAFLADPELSQVVSHTFETGVRGGYHRQRLKLDYAVAAFQTTNANDIIFISSGTVASQGYFKNVGDTRRQGLEAQLSGRHSFDARGRLDWTLAYTFTDATFQSPFTALSAAHPDAINGSIPVPAGAQIPSIPKHVGKAGVTFMAPFGLSGGVNVVAQSGQYYRGDEANRLPQIAGYVVVNARLAYQLAQPVSVFVLVDNIFNQRYSTFGVLGDATEVLGPKFNDPRFVGVGAPRAAWGGVDVHY